MQIFEFFIDVNCLPHTFPGFVQLLSLGGAYSACLMYAAHLIYDGSELLLLIPSLSGLIGSVILPILGAVPDACVVLYSGLRPNAQEDMAVGVGALAGATIMVLTVPWFLSILGGRVNLHEDTGLPDYENVGKTKLIPLSLLTLNKTGVRVTKAVNVNSFIMLVTAVTYLILQLPGAEYLHASNRIIAKNERTWAILGTIVCVVFFSCYIYYQYSLSTNLHTTQNLSRDEYLRAAFTTNKLTLLSLFIFEMKLYYTNNTSMLTASSLLATDSETGTSNNYSSVAESPLHVSMTALSQEADEIKSDHAADGTNNYGYNGGHINNSLDFESVPDEVLQRFEELLLPFFRAYDVSRQNKIRCDELSALLRDLGESVSRRKLDRLLQVMDSDSTGFIAFQSFAAGMIKFIVTNMNRSLRVGASDPQTQDSAHGDPDTLTESTKIRNYSADSSDGYDATMGEAAARRDSGAFASNNGMVSKSSLLKSSFMGDEEAFRTYQNFSSQSYPSDAGSYRAINASGCAESGSHHNTPNKKLPAGSSHTAAAASTPWTNLSSNDHGGHVSAKGAAAASAANDLSERSSLLIDVEPLQRTEQAHHIVLKSLLMMLSGTVIVLLVSDPVVGVISEIGKRTGIPAFYVSYVLSPLATSASELVAAYNYSLKKTPESISISISSLLGAAIMNNTLVFGIFMFLIWTRRLAWEFCAETFAILVVQIAVSLMACKSTHTVLDGLFMLAFYPAAIFIVVAMEYAGWD